ALREALGLDAWHDEEALLREVTIDARAGAVTEVLHGVSVFDPYRALETDSPATRAWIDAHSARTRQALADGVTRLRRRIEALLSIGAGGEPALAGESLFYTERRGDAQQPILYVRTDDGPPRRLLDPTSLGPRASLDYF